MRWMPIEGGTPKWGAQTVFALINQGTPHECHQVTILQYDADLKKWRDKHGDVDDNSVVTHYLVEVPKAHNVPKPKNDKPI